jgi:BirA family biotin operon repressor/biotin-[acetyl-CoA-carboxylase] ligase
MASSIFLQTGAHVKRSSIIAAFARYFSKYYDEFLINLNLSGLLEDYNESLINAGREVRIIERDGEYTATAVGIDETGMLEVKLPDGETKKIVSGEVSVRGLYGYV